MQRKVWGGINNMEKNIQINTPLGTLVASPVGGKEYPGIYISL